MVWRAAFVAFALGAPVCAYAQGAPNEPAQVSKDATSLRCDDWKKVGAHRWMVVKEVMLGTARRTGTTLQNTPETDALDSKCAR